MLKMAQPLPKINVQEGIEPLTITLHIFSPTIEPQLFMSFVNFMSNQIKQTQSSSNTAQNFQSKNIFILDIKCFLLNFRQVWRSGRGVA